MKWKPQGETTKTQRSVKQTDIIDNKNKTGNIAENNKKKSEF